MDDELGRLADLLRRRDALDAEIAAVTGRSARQGDVGEFIASRVFDIELAATATQAGYDGLFRSGPLMGRTVNVKTYGDATTGIDLGVHPCAFLLVLSGPARGPGAVRHHPQRISSVFLFDVVRLVADLRARGVRIGVAASVTRSALEAAQVFPVCAPGALLTLTADQRDALRLFA